MSTSAIYRSMTDGTFLKQIQLGSRFVVWLESGFTKLMEDQIKNLFRPCADESVLL